VGDRLACFPFQSQSLGMKVDYMDWDDDTSEWKHLACVYDLHGDQMDGYIFIQGETISYQNSIPDSNKRTYPNQRYRLTINNEANRVRNGIERASYKEFRLWKYPRTASQIINGKYQMIDPYTERSSMLSYIKFANGGFPHS